MNGFCRNGFTQWPRRLAPNPLALEISSIFARRGAAGAMVLAGALATPWAGAAPQDAKVSAGQASVQQNGAQTTITQGSQRAAIDWRSFNVGVGESVNFVQPNAASATLNRVVGVEPSAIFGRITANGQVLLINPNGVVFGRTAQVDVGGLVASTANISNANFMAGKMEFTEPGKPGATVENQGSITVAEGGFAALVGRGVSNSGVINARLGKVTLAAGDAFVLDLYGDQLVNLVVDPAAMTAMTDVTGTPLAARVDHSGRIVADGGRVQLTAATVKQLVDSIINVSGVVRATSFETAPGRISLKGDANTRVAVSGHLDASGTVGGRIELTGREVMLASAAQLSASGSTAGGSVSVGGDWQGKGPLMNAKLVTIEPGAQIDARATGQGQGGTVAIWSDDRTRFEGRVDVRGGAAGGDGGKVEVSSKGQLGFLGDVDVFAVNGSAGSVLLDPANLRIGTVSSGDSEVSAEQLRFLLTRGATVTLSADQNVTVDAEVNGLATGGVARGGLTLSAGNNLTVNQNIVLNDGALNLAAANGTLSSAAGTVFYTGNGAVNLRGGAGVDVGRVISAGVVDIQSANGGVTVRNALVAASADGSAAPLASLNVDGAGTVVLNGALSQGNVNVLSRTADVRLGAAMIQSQAGNVQVGAGGSIISGATNVGLQAAGAVTATAAQAIDLGLVVSAGETTLTTSGNGAGSGVTVHQAITGTGTVAVGKLTINAGGPVTLAGVNAGAGGIAITARSGNVTSSGASAAESGLLSAGGVTLHANAGQAGTSAAPLNVLATAGDVLLDGNTGVNAATLLGRGAVTLAAAAGGVTVTQAIAADAGLANAGTTARPTGIAITARDAIDFKGGVVGAGGVSIDSSAGTVTLRDSSLFSNGPVNMAATGVLSLLDGAGIQTATGTGAVTLTSRTGGVTVGNAGIRATGEAVNVSLASRADLNVRGDIQTPSGTIDLSSTQGAVRVLSSSSADAALNATLDAGGDATRSKISIHANGDVDVGEMIAYSSVQLTSDAGNVLLRRGLGGNRTTVVDGNTLQLNTGYVNYADGYQTQYRPNVGRLVIGAPLGSVELNGVNIDGNAGPTDTGAGLSVKAGRRIVSNAEIAVNKGDIELTIEPTGGPVQASDGVYLGNSVYSRGWDSVGADKLRGTADDQKIGYGIRIGGRVLGLFDNTVEVAQLPVQTFTVSWVDSQTVSHEVRTDGLGFAVDAAGLRLRNADGTFQLVGYLRSVVTANPGSATAANLRVFNVTYNAATGVKLTSANEEVLGVQGVVAPPVQQEIAKIEVANNAANYQDAANRTTLVPTTTGNLADRRVQIDTTVIAGVANHTPQTAMHLDDPLPIPIALSQTPRDVVPGQKGIGLKVLSFREVGDASSVVWSTAITLGSTTSGPTLGLGDFFQAGSGSESASINGNTPFTVAAPVDGRFTITVPALAARTYTFSDSVTPPETRTQYERMPDGTEQATFTFELVPQSALVRVVSVVPALSAAFNSSALSTVALPTGGSAPGSWVRANWRDEGALAGLRLQGTPSLGVRGGAAGIGIAASLYGAQTGTGSTAVLQTGTLLAPAFDYQVRDYRQVGPGADPQAFFGSGESRPYIVSNIVADSSARGSYATKPGTRVFIYDGIVDSANGTFRVDGANGVIVPGLSGIPGSNNSTIGFAGVGAGFGSLAGGTIGPIAVNGSGSQGFGGVGMPSAQNGGSVLAIADRSLQDSGAAESAAGGSYALLAAGDVSFGLRPSALADLGRSGSVPSSSVNVFKRRFPLATSSSSTVCAPGTVQTTAAAGSPARDCPAAK